MLIGIRLHFTKGAVFMKQKIFLNQVGYISHMHKTAAFTGSGSYYQIIEAKTNKPVYSGTIPEAVYDEASGDDVSILDFSTFNMHGNFYIKIGRMRSHVFSINNAPFRAVKNALLKGLYYNRCGETKTQFAGEYAHDECHTEEAVLYENHDRKMDVSGGWHISGNYAKYVTLSAVMLGHLLYAYRLYPRAFRDNINIPESSDDMPDILCECRYELEWLLKMQGRDGGVYHKACTLDASGFVLPQNDKETVYVFPKSHQATANFAAITAQAAMIYRSFDAEFAETLEVAAINAWIWIMNNPHYKPFENPSDVSYQTTGDIPDDNYYDDLFWAVCELYSLNGDYVFHEKVREYYPKIGRAGFDICDVGGFGVAAYSITQRKTYPDILHKMKTNLRISADNLYSISQKSGYASAIQPDDYVLDSNLNILTSGITLAFAYNMLECEEYLQAALEQLNYILGKNPVGTGFITGIGTVCVKNPHHRLSGFDDIDAPVPGLVVNGPNKIKSDEFALWNIPNDTPPAKCYFDSALCFSSNEVMLYCNTAAIFVTAFIDTLEN